MSIKSYKLKTGGSTMRQKKEITYCSTTQAVIDLLKNNKGKMFYLKYKKLDGSIREGQFRLGVTKGIIGKPSYDASLRGNIILFETIPQRDNKGIIRGNDTQRRTCKAENIMELHMRNRVLICR